jgi:cyclase
MIWPRLIPILTVITDSVQKTTQFQNPVYVGDPLNSVTLFSQLNADELIVLDISRAHGCPPMNQELISRVIDHANLPIGFGGGMRSLDDVKFVFDCGYDKVIIRTLATDLVILGKIANHFGSQALTVSLDIKYHPDGEHWSLVDHPEIADGEVIDFARKLVEAGVGEIVIQDVLREGTREGLRKSKLIDNLVENLEIPVVLSGGCKSFTEAAEYIVDTRVHSIAGSQMFLYKQPRNALLLNYPTGKAWISSLSNGS